MRQSRELRNKIAEIFVKHGLPTRQIAISEILELIIEERGKVVTFVDGELGRIIDKYKYE